MTKRKRVLAIAISIVFLGAAISAGAQSYTVPAKRGPYVVGLSNSFSGNSWRAQMVAEFKSEAEKLKADGTLKDYIVADATGSTASQIQQIQNMIAQKVDAIIIDANSPTALNPVIQTAHRAGILVFAFDNIVDSPYAYTFTIDQTAFGRLGGEWLVKKLNGKGNILVLNGLQGAPDNASRWNGAKGVFDKNPGIKVLSAVNADWDQAKAQQAVANLLPSFPHIDGVWSQGGAMTLGAVYAFQAAGRPLVPMSGEANNGLLKVWKKELSNGFDSIAPACPSTMGAMALDSAVKVLGGEKMQKATLLTPPVITSDTLDQFVRPDLSDALWLPTILSPEQLQALFH